MATVDRRGVSVDATDTPIVGDPNPGLAIKAPCLVATTGNISLAGVAAVDGLVVGNNNERVLVKNQTDPTLNGIYNAQPGNWQRAIDARSTSQWTAGTQVLVTAGSQADNVYVQQTLAPVVIGTTDLVFGRYTIGLLAANNLSDVDDPAAALENLGGLAQSANLVDVANAGTALTNLGGIGRGTLFTSLLAGTVPASGGGTAKFLRADESWAVPTNNLITPQQFNAGGSGAATTGSILAGQTALTLASALDFANGQGIRVNHAGAAFAVGAPTGLVITPTGTSGSTTYAYTIASLDASGGVGKAITNVTTTTGNATLSGTNFNALAWSAPAGTAPAAYAIYGNKSGSLALIGISTSPSFFDVGAGAITTPDWIPAAPQVSASLADWLVTTITGGAGTTALTLAANATTAATAQLAIHDDTAALQATINLAQTSGTGLLLTQGSYPISSGLTITSRIQIVGVGYQGDSGLSNIGAADSYNTAGSITAASGWRASVIICAPCCNAFNIATNDALDLSKFQITYPVQGFRGTIAINAIAAAGGTSSNTYSTFRDIYISGADIGISLNDWLNFTIDHCVIAPWSTSVIIQTPNYPSFGDSTICNCVMFGRTIVQHILAFSIGGLRIVNNKIVSGGVGIFFNANLIGNQFEPVVIVGNSIEGQIQGIVFQQNGGSTTQTSQVVISGNQLFVGTFGVNMVYGGNAWIRAVAITGNTVTIFSTTGVCLNLDGVTTGVVCGNAFANGAANGTGVGLGAHATGINVQSNAYDGGLATKVANSGSGNTVGGGSS